MEQFDKHTGVAIPLDRSNVDTDQIIPAVWLRKIERTGFHEGLFSSWRQHDEFVLNHPVHSKGSILVARENFGIGSSREHAVWALIDYGIRVVISPRFGDIFANNSTKSGLVPVVLEPEICDLLIKAALDEPGLEITVDLENRTVSAPEIGVEVEFKIDDHTRHRLLEGLDDIGLTVQYEDMIEQYEQLRPAWMPVVPTP